MDGVTMLSLCYRAEGRLTLKLSWVAKTAPRMKGIREFAQGDLGGRKTGYFRLT